MKFIERYRRLSLWNKLYVWGSAASILGLVVYFASSVRPTSPSGISQERVAKLILLRKEGDQLFQECLRMNSKDIPYISVSIAGWEARVQKEVSTISQIALNRIEAAQRRRKSTVYAGRNSEYASWLDRLEFQIEALNEVINEG